MSTPSLSKHFIKELLKPAIAGATPEMVARMKTNKDKVEWKTYIETMKPFMRRGNIHKTMDQRMGLGPNLQIAK